MGIRRIILLFILSAVLPIVVGRCSTEKHKQPPNIILISIDALRADYFSPEHMPLLWDFAKKNCLVFSNAHSNSTWTKPSHVTMLTGMLQSKHGVEYRDSSIPEEIVMVQERLKQTGYHTVAFTGGGFVNKHFEMGRGFDSFYQSRVSPGAEESELARHFERIRLPLDKATEFLNRPDTASGPTLIFVHTYEVHEWWLHYFPPETVSQNRKQKAQQWKQFRSETSFKQKRQVYGRTAREFDRRLMDFLRALLSSQYKDNLRIIITSDHGEGLGDKHGDFMRLRHAGPPYSDQIRIPLIVYGIGKGTSDRLIGIDDITPLILWLAGIADSPLIDDRDILISEYISKERDDPNRTVAIFTPEGKYLLSPDGVLHLYRDPEDSVDLLHPEGIGEERTEIPENLKQELEALGYLE